MDCIGYSGYPLRGILFDEAGKEICRIGYKYVNTRRKDYFQGVMGLGEKRNQKTIEIMGRNCDFHIGQRVRLESEKNLLAVTGTADRLQNEYNPRGFRYFILELE